MKAKDKRAEGLPNVRLTPSELKALRVAAAATDQSFSAWVRNTLLAATPLNENHGRTPMARTKVLV